MTWNIKQAPLVLWSRKVYLDPQIRRGLKLVRRGLKLASHIVPWPFGFFLFWFGYHEVMHNRPMFGVVLGSALILSIQSLRYKHAPMLIGVAGIMVVLHAFSVYGDVDLVSPGQHQRNYRIRFCASMLFFAGSLMLSSLLLKLALVAVIKRHKTELQQELSPSPADSVT